MPILTDSNVAEALALMKGIEFARDMLLFLHLCAESDSSNVISAIKDNQPISPYTEDCIKLIPNFNRISFCVLLIKLLTN